MSCTQTLNGIARDCQSSIGGVKRVLLANRDDVSAITKTDGIVTAISMATGATFKEYYLRRFSGSLVSAYQVNENGSPYVLSTLVMSFSRLEASKRLEVTAIAQADLVGIVEDLNGKFWYVGEDDPLALADGTDANTGTQRADFNGYNVTLEAASRELPPEVNSGIIDGLLSA